MPNLWLFACLWSANPTYAADAPLCAPMRAAECVALTARWEATPEYAVAVACYAVRGRRVP
jgi:hypothetical protein